MGEEVGRWAASPEDLERLQAALAVMATEETRWSPPDDTLTVGAVFAAFPTGVEGVGAVVEPAWAAAVLMESGRVVGHAVVRGTAGGPYAPGHLALQRGPVLEAAVRALPQPPNVLLVNATGKDHPRRAGLALHLGAVLDIASIGVTDHPLVASGPEPDLERGSATPLMLGEEPVGYRLRTRTRARPIVVHAAWRTDPDSARAVVMEATSRVRTTEPLRVARRLARIERARGEGRLPLGWEPRL